MVGIGRKGDYKTAERRARKNLATHFQLMNYFISEGHAKLEASSMAMEVIEGKREKPEMNEAMKYECGEIVILNRREKRFGEIQEATIRAAILQCDADGFGYQTIDAPDGQYSGAHFFKNEGKNFGIISVQKTGESCKPATSWSPKPGDRGYDLMH